MSLLLSTPDRHGLTGTVDVLRSWQSDRAPMQLHPGDLGWYERHGTQRAATAVRTWSRDGHVVAVALLDGPRLARLTLAPELHADEAVAVAVATDLDDPGRGVLPAGPGYVEAPDGYALKPALEVRGWVVDEAWTPLSRQLAEPVADPGLQVELVGPERAADWSAVLASAGAAGTPGPPGSAPGTPPAWSAMTDAVLRSRRSPCGRPVRGGPA